MSELQEAIDAATAEFVEGLERRGFRANGQTLSGLLPGEPSPTLVRIVLPEEFPFAPPKVSPPEDFPRSWHRERNGEMCLYAADERENLPWLDVDNFLQLVARWVAESQSGWPGDLPDLDLDRYFESRPEPLVVYGDLDAIGNKFVRLRHERHVTRVVGAGSIPKGTKGLSKTRAFGYVACIGEPPTPPTSWEELQSMIATHDARTIEQAVRDRRFTYLIVRYTRGGIRAAVVLRATPSDSDTVHFAAVHSASESPETLRLRAGREADRLADSKVVVVGAGAIGSFVCDLLTRAGVGTITVIDHDVLRPGNLIRYVAGAESVGLAKPDAIRNCLEARPYNRSRVVADARSVNSPREVMKLFGNHDLVIDATAAGGTTDLLAKAAEAGGHHVLSACVQEDGKVVRVDILPPPDGQPLPQVTTQGHGARQDLRFEAGCGDPVSLTPAFAVFEAASLTVRLAVDLLTGHPPASSGIVRDYR